MPYSQERLFAVGDPGRRLLAVEREEDDRRANRPRLDRPGELHQHRRPRRAVVRAHEPGELFRVVVRGDDDVARRVAPADEADDVPQPARHELVRAPGQRGLQLRGELARRRRAGRPRPEPHLGDEPRPRGVLVEAIDRGPRNRRSQRGRGERGRCGPRRQEQSHGLDPALLTRRGGRVRLRLPERVPRGEVG